MMYLQCPVPIVISDEECVLLFIFLPLLRPVAFGFTKIARDNLSNVVHNVDRLNIDVSMDGHIKYT